MFITDLGLRFLRDVVFRNPLTLVGTVIGLVGGIAGLWDPLVGGFMGAVVGFLASTVLENPDEGPTIPQRVGLLIGTVVVILVASKLID